MKNPAGRIVSKKKHEAGKHALKFLHAKGYIAVKGKFGSKRATTDAVADVVVDATTHAEPVSKETVDVEVAAPQPTRAKGKE